MKRFLLTTVLLLSVSNAQFAQDAADSDEQKNQAAEPDQQETRDDFVAQAVHELIEETCSNHLTMWIEDCTNAIDLSKKEVARLRIAAKGAAAKFADKKLESERQFVIDRVNDLLQDAHEFALNGKLVDLEKLAISPKRILDSKKLDELAPLRVTFRMQSHGVSWNFRRKNGSSGYGRSDGIDQLESIKVWANAKKKIIGEKKLNKFEAFQRNRANQAATIVALKFMTVKLRLNEEQQKQVAEWLEGKIELPSSYDQQQHYEFVRMPIVQLNQKKGLEKILTPRQFQQWQAELGALTR